MAIEQTDGRAAWSYRLDPSDPLMVQRRQNKHGAHWHDWQRYPDLYSARGAVIRQRRIAETESQRDA